MTLFTRRKSSKRRRLSAYSPEGMQQKSNVGGYTGNLETFALIEKDCEGFEARLNQSGECADAGPPDVDESSLERSGEHQTAAAKAIEEDDELSVAVRSEEDANSDQDSPTDENTNVRQVSQNEPVDDGITRSCREENTVPPIENKELAEAIELPLESFEQCREDVREDEVPSTRATSTKERRDHLKKLLSWRSSKEKAKEKRVEMSVDIHQEQSTETCCNDRTEPPSAEARSPSVTEHAETHETLFSIAGPEEIKVQDTREASEHPLPTSRGENLSPSAPKELSVAGAAPTTEEDRHDEEEMGDLPGNTNGEAIEINMQSGDIVGTRHTSHKHHGLKAFTSGIGWPRREHNESPKGDGKSTKPSTTKKTRPHWPLRRDKDPMQEDEKANSTLATTESRPTLTTGLSWRSRKLDDRLNDSTSVNAVATSKSRPSLKTSRSWRSWRNKGSIMDELQDDSVSVRTSGSRRSLLRPLSLLRKRSHDSVDEKSTKRETFFVIKAIQQTSSLRNRLFRKGDDTASLDSWNRKRSDEDDFSACVLFMDEVNETCFFFQSLKERTEEDCQNYACDRRDQK